EVTGDYSSCETDTSGSTLYPSSTVVDSPNWADGSTVSDNEGDTATGYESDSSTVHTTGNEVDGYYSMTETDSHDSTATSTSGGSQSLIFSDSGTDNSGDGATQTAIATTGATITKTADETT